MKPAVGDTVYISEKSRSYGAGRSGKVAGYTGTGRVLVKLKHGFVARVRLENVKLLLDKYDDEKEV